MALTIEDFANRCLRIANGDVSLVAPCCANCKHYKPIIDLMVFLGSEPTDCACEHPAEKHPLDSLLKTKPEDFCSRFEENTDG